MTEDKRRTDDVLNDLFVAQVLNLSCQLRQWNIETGAVPATEPPSAFIRSALQAIRENRDEILSMWQHARPHD